MLKTSLRHEISRKFIHLTSLWIPLIYLFYGQYLCFILLVITTSGMFLLDFARISKGKFHQLLKPILSATKLDQIFRSHENKTLSGASYMLGGALLGIMMFNKTTFITAYLILVISDTLAALIGLAFAKHKLIGNKTLEGSLAFFISAILITTICETSTSAAYIACVFTTLAELFAKRIKIDDNLLIPFGYCLTFELCKKLIG